MAFNWAATRLATLPLAAMISVLSPMVTLRLSTPGPRTSGLDGHTLTIYGSVGQATTGLRILSRTRDLGRRTRAANLTGHDPRSSHVETRAGQCKPRREHADSLGVET